MIIRVGKICLNTLYREYTVLLKDKFRLQAYTTNGTSTSTMTKPRPQVELPVSRVTIIFVTRGTEERSGCEVPFNFS